MRIRSNLPKVNPGSIRRIFKQFGHHLDGYRGKLVISGLALFGVTFVTILRPWPLKVIIDFVLLPDQSSSTDSLLAPLAELDFHTILALAAGTVVVLAGIQGLLNYVHAVVAKTVGHMLVAAIRLQLFSHVQKLPLSYHDYRETGDLLTRLTDDISLLENLLVSTVINVGSQILLVVGMVSVMFWLDWQLGLVVLAILPVFLLAAFKFSVRIKSSAKKQREMYGKIVASVQESLAGISQIKSYSQEKKREKIVSQSASRDVKASVQTTRLTANYERVVDLIIAVGTALVLWIGATKAYSGEISAGDLIIFLSYLRGVYRPIKSMARQTTRVAKAVVRGEKILELLDMKPEVLETSDGLSAKGITGDIRFKNVSFSYVSDRSVLHDLSCHIPGGKTTIILGSTGAGKSTIAKLILRLYKQQTGNIQVDGLDISDYKVRSLRKQIAPLAQETFLFRTSIAENIAFGRRKASDEEIIEAAKLSGIDAFVDELPDRYDTIVGEGGVTLSGGQRQRISFARAALRQAPIMIFDEPATGLDVHAEIQTKEVLCRLRTDRTLLIITHRLHFLDIADWVVLVRDGQVIEEGTPDELYARQSAYYRFVSVETNSSATGSSDENESTPEQCDSSVISNENGGAK